MIDDHDRCEWVDIYSGTGSPGCPGQNLESHKMVVCVTAVAKYAANLDIRRELGSLWWLWIVPSPAMLRYIMHFPFCG